MDTEYYNKLFSQRLKMLREENGWTVEELAEKLETSKSNISFYENNKRLPGYEMLFKMMRLFNVSVDYIIGASDDRGLTVLQSRKTLPR